MSKQRIFHIITDLGDGGAEAVLWRLLQATPEFDHSVISLSGHGKYGPLLEECGISVVSLGMKNNFLSVAATIPHLRSLLVQGQPALVHTWMYHADLVGGLAARLAGIRSVIWCLHNGSVSPLHNPFARQRVIKANARLSRSIPARIVSCSQGALEAHRSIGYAREKLIFVPNGYPVDQFSPDPVARLEIRREFGIEPDMLLLGMVARLDGAKDHSNLLKALEILRSKLDFRCLLVGRGVEPNSVLRSEIVARQLDDVIILVGSRTDIPRIMNALDIHILSSIYEAFPNILCEAMACGTLCVATNVGDCANIVGDTGWVVAPGAPDQLAEAILTASVCATDKERKAAARARIVDNFSIERMRNAYVDLWCRMVA